MLLHLEIRPRFSRRSTRARRLSVRVCGWLSVPPTAAVAAVRSCERQDWVSAHPPGGPGAEDRVVIRARLAVAEPQLDTKRRPVIFIPTQRQAYFREDRGCQRPWWCARYPVQQLWWCNRNPVVRRRCSPGPMMMRGSCR